jgi:hypothetical protein
MYRSAQKRLARSGWQMAVGWKRCLTNRFIANRFSTNRVITNRFTTTRFITNRFTAR